MANTKSAKKAILVNRRNNARNAHYKTQIKSAIKETLTAISSNSDNKATLLQDTLQLIDKVAGKKVIKKTTAARKKSLLHNKYLDAFGKTSTSTFTKKSSAPAAAKATTEKKTATKKTTTTKKAAPKKETAAKKAPVAKKTTPPKKQATKETTTPKVSEKVADAPEEVTEPTNPTES